MISSPDGKDLMNGFNGQIGPTTPNQSGIIRNVAELAQTVYAGYNGAEYGPISIIPVDVHGGDHAGPTYLVTISGTELVQGQSTGIFTDIKMGMNQANNLTAAAIKAINEAEGLTILLVEQDANLALDIAQHGYLLETGRVVLDDSAEHLHRNEAVRRSYLGY